jgi:UDP-glucose 6-dehydrogenase
MMDTSVVGVDPIQTKVDLITQGRPPIIGQEIGGTIAAKRQVQGTPGPLSTRRKPVKVTDLSYVCILGRKYGRKSVITTTWGDEDGLL